MSFDRSKYKKSKSLQDQQKELVDSGQIKEKGSNGIPELLEIKKDGEYYLKFWPSHLAENGEPLSYFMMLKKYHFAKFMKNKYEDGALKKGPDGNPVQELGIGTILNSVAHGSNDMDMFDEYIKFVRNLGMELYPNDKEAYKTYMKHIYGHGHGKNYTGGITATEEYIAYASLINKDTMKEISFNRVVLKSSMRKAMLKISATEDDGEGITTDPFTDPDDGLLQNIAKIITKYC